MTRTPAVTVGIPTYRRPEGLDGTLRMIEAQDYANLEILVGVNDANSPDPATREALAVAGLHERRDQRVRIIEHPTNLGAWGITASLVQRAPAPLFMWAPDDDYWFADTVSACVAAHQESGSPFVVPPMGFLYEHECRSGLGPSPRLANWFAIDAGGIALAEDRALRRICCTRGGHGRRALQVLAAAIRKRDTDTGDRS